MAGFPCSLTKVGAFPIDFVYCLERELDSNADTFGYFFPRMVSRPSFLQKNMYFKWIVENILLFVANMALQKNIFEEFLAVRMALQKTFLNGF